MLNLTTAMDLGTEDMDMDLPTLWDAVSLEMSTDMRGAGELRDLGYLAWDASMAWENGELVIVDEDLFLQAQEFFAKAQEIETMHVS